MDLEKCIDMVWRADTMSLSDVQVSNGRLPLKDLFLLLPSILLCPFTKQMLYLHMCCYEVRFQCWSSPVSSSNFELASFCVVLIMKEAAIHFLDILLMVRSEVLILYFECRFAYTDVSNYY